MRHGRTWGLTVSSNFLSHFFNGQMNHSPKHQGRCFSQSVQYIIYEPLPPSPPPPPPPPFQYLQYTHQYNLTHFTFSKVFLFLESEVIILKKIFFYWPSFSLLFLTIPGNTGILDLADYLTFTPGYCLPEKSQKINFISVKIQRKKLQSKTTELCPQILKLR